MDTRPVEPSARYRTRRQVWTARIIFGAIAAWDLWSAFTGHHAWWMTTIGLLLAVGLVAAVAYDERKRPARH